MGSKNTKKIGRKTNKMARSQRARRLRERLKPEVAERLATPSVAELGHAYCSLEAKMGSKRTKTIGRKTNKIAKTQKARWLRERLKQAAAEHPVTPSALELDHANRSPHVPEDCVELLCLKDDSKNKLCLKDDSKNKLCIKDDSKDKFCIKDDSKNELCIKDDSKNEFCIKDDGKNKLCIKDDSKNEFCSKDDSKDKLCLKDDSKDKLCLKDDSKNKLCSKDDSKDKLCIKDDSKNKFCIKDDSTNKLCIKDDSKNKLCSKSDSQNKKVLPTKLTSSEKSTVASCKKRGLLFAQSPSASRAKVAKSSLASAVKQHPKVVVLKSPGKLSIVTPECHRPQRYTHDYLHRSPAAQEERFIAQENAVKMQLSRLSHAALELQREVLILRHQHAKATLDLQLERLERATEEGSESVQHLLEQLEACGNPMQI